MPSFNVAFEPVLGAEVVAAADLRPLVVPWRSRVLDASDRESSGTASAAAAAEVGAADAPAETAPAPAEVAVVDTGRWRGGAMRVMGNFEQDRGLRYLQRAEEGGLCRGHGRARAGVVIGA